MWTTFRRRRAWQNFRRVCVWGTGVGWEAVDTAHPRPADTHSCKWPHLLSYTWQARRPWREREAGDQTHKNCGSGPLTLPWVPLLVQERHQALGMGSAIRSQLVGEPQSRGNDKSSLLTLCFRSVKCNVISCFRESKASSIMSQNKSLPQPTGSLFLPRPSPSQDRVLFSMQPREPDIRGLISNSYKVTKLDTQTGEWKLMRHGLLPSFPSVTP